MKTIKTLLVLLIITAFSCDNNDDAQTDPVTPTDGFTHNSVFYETANAYFEIDEDDDSPSDGFPDNYSFFFSNGRMFDNDANVNGSSGDFLFSLNTTNWVFLNIEVSDNPSLANTGPSAGNTYVVSSINDTVIIENGQIDALTPSYFNNSIEFGTGNENVGIVNTPGTQGSSITINAINLDANNPAASTIDVDYTMMNQNGEIITGHYEGTFGVILD
ncbi:hypothetical protein [Olleya sp. R77988]|uniref:hypothetical protein n=1 Tax=Olleya sp. R77988 TaxID=3093875 RepID=UPI0037CB1975